MNLAGEPVICGFARTFGQRLPDGSRCEYVKPIMFSGGIGSIDENQVQKRGPEAGMLLAKIGGPAYRTGVGGGTASSVSVQGVLLLVCSLRLPFCFLGSCSEN